MCKLKKGIALEYKAKGSVDGTHSWWGQEHLNNRGTGSAKLKVGVRRRREHMVQGNMLQREVHFFSICNNRCDFSWPSW